MTNAAGLATAVSMDLAHLITPRMRPRAVAAKADADAAAILNAARPHLGKSHV